MNSNKTLTRSKWTELDTLILKINKKCKMIVLLSKTVEGSVLSQVRWCSKCQMHRGTVVQREEKTDLSRDMASTCVFQLCLKNYHNDKQACAGVFQILCTRNPQNKGRWSQVDIRYIYSICIYKYIYFSSCMTLAPQYIFHHFVLLVGLIDHRFYHISLGIVKFCPKIASVPCVLHL